jgi:hypothetical protein
MMRMRRSCWLRFIMLLSARMIELIGEGSGDSFTVDGVGFVLGRRVL